MTCAHAVCSGQGKPPGTPNAILPSRMPSPPCAVSCGSHSFLQPPGPVPISQISRAPFSNASPTPLATQPEMAKVKLRDTILAINGGDNDEDDQDRSLGGAHSRAQRHLRTRAATDPIGSRCHLPSGSHT